MDRRFSEHSSAHGGRKGAKYFRARTPEKLVYIEDGHSRSTASQREAAIKKLSRQEKLSLINSATNSIQSGNDNTVES